MGLFVASALAYAYLTWRIQGVFVSVLNDEYTYLVDTLPEGEFKTGLPNYLFRFVYSSTLSCGTEFYSCARSLNALFVVGSALFIYFIARRLSGKIWIAALSGASAVLGSLGTYTAYFMPEAIFNFFMIAFFWAILRFGLSTNPLVWAGIGSVAGIASLGKPHAFFVMPAVIIFVFLWTRASHSNYLLIALLKLGPMLGSMLTVKLAIGYLLAGDPGVTVFGAYGGAISSAESASETFGPDTWGNLPVSTWGQILMTTMILGLSLTVSLPQLIVAFGRDQSHFGLGLFRVFFALALMNMMAVSAFFEAWVDISDWMHTRYHSYLVPLGILVFAEASRSWKVQVDKRLKLSAVTVFAILSAISLVTAAEPYGTNWVDAPDFRFHIENPEMSSVLLLFALGIAIWWLWDERLSMQIAVVFGLVSSLLVGLFISGYLKSDFATETPYDQLGRHLREYLPPGELNKTVLVGDNFVHLDRALFMAVNGSATKIEAPVGEFDATELSTQFEWLVSVDQVSPINAGQPVFTGNSFKLYNLKDGAPQLSVGDPGYSLANKCSEMQSLEWSCGAFTELSIGSPFPANARLDMIVEFSDFAANAELEFSLGDSTIVGKPTSSRFAFTLNFANLTEENVLSIRTRQQLPASDEPLLRIISVTVVD